MTTLLNENQTNHGDFKVTLPSATYNNFVAHRNFKDMLDIGYVSISDQHVETTQTGASGEKFIMLLNNTRHYFNTFVMERNIDVTIKGIKYSQNKQFIYESDALLANSKTESRTNSKITVNDYTGLPHPYFPGIFGFVCDPINSMTDSIKLEFSGLNESTSLNSKYVNIVRKATDTDVLTDGRYKNLLYPETLNLDSLSLPGNKSQILPFVPQLCHYEWDLPADSEEKGTKVFAHIPSSKEGYRKKAANRDYMTLEDINAVDTNMLSFNKRGKIFEDAIYTYKKSMESYNYEYNFNQKAI